MKRPIMGMAVLILTMPALAAELASQQGTASDTEQVVVEKVKVGAILPDRLEAVPGSFDVVDEKELKARQPFSVREALNQVPGINIVGEDAFVLAPNIGIRGLNPRRTSRTLLMEDGVPLFLAPYGDPSAHYSTPLDRVSRIEVVKGSGQTLYGPQTVGGMINFVTKPVPKEFQASVMAIIGNNNFSGGHVNIGTGGDWGGIMLDAVNRKGDGIRKNHDFEINELTLKGQLNLDDRNTLIAKVGWYEENSSISETGLGAVEYAEDRYQAPTGKQDSFNHERKSLHLQHIFQVTDRAKLSTQFYYAKSERASFRQVNDPGTSNGRSVMDRCTSLGVATEANSANCGGRWRPREYEYWGIEPRLDISHNLFGIESDAVIGFRYHREDIQRNQYRDGNRLAQNLGWAIANGSHREDIGINVEAKSYYAQNTFYVGDWSLTPGVRIEDMSISTNIRRAEGVGHNNPESDQTNHQSKVLPGFGIAWNGIENTTFFAGVHRGFAPPRPDRDIQVPEDGNGDPIPNSAIAHKVKPEQSTNWELGLRSNYHKALRYEATLFHTKFDEIVVSNGFGGFVNGGESEHSGIELAGRLDFGTLYNTSHNFYVAGSYTNVFTAKFKKASAAEDIQRGDRLAYTPKHIASLNFGYEHPVGFNARIGVDYVSEQQEDMKFRSGASEFSLLDGRSGRIPSYTLLNASVSYRPVGSKATFFVSGNNLADKEYLASRVDGMAAGRQRQVFGGVRYDF